MSQTEILPEQPYYEDRYINAPSQEIAEAFLGNENYSMTPLPNGDYLKMITTDDSYQNYQFSVSVTKAENVANTVDHLDAYSSRFNGEVSLEEQAKFYGP